MTWPVVVFWLLIAWGAFSRGPLLTYLFFSSLAFGALSLVPFTSSFNALPGQICAVAIIVRVLCGQGMFPRALSVALDPARLGILTAFLLVSLIVTLFGPLLFEGSISVIFVPGNPQLLSPGMNNLNQAANLTLSVGTAVAFALISAQRGSYKVLARSYVIQGVILGLSGAIALAADVTGLSDLLQPFRNVSWALLIDSEVLGTRRLTGFMTEASAFGGACVFAAFGLTFLQLSLSGAEKFLARASAAALFVFAALSTSSTAYIGIAFSFVVILADSLRRFVFSSARNYRGGMLPLAFAGVTAAVGVLAFAPETFDYPIQMLQSVIFEKNTSSSYVERMSWNESAVAAFFSSGGLGVGLGSSRASNWFVAVLSNTGAIGAALMCIFVIQTLIKHPRTRDKRIREMVVALKAMLLISFVQGALSATNADFGPWIGATYGMIAGLCEQADDIPDKSYIAKKGHAFPNA